MARFATCRKSHTIVEYFSMPPIIQLQQFRPTKSKSHIIHIMIRIFIDILLLLLLLLSSTHQQDTLLHRVFCGYQGWFTAGSDGSGNGYTHYKMHSSRPFAKDNCVIDFWPDTKDYAKKYSVPELGDQAQLFSPYDYSSVLIHFEWMKQYGIDGVFLQRFGSDIRDKGSNIYKFKNKVFENVMNSAKATNKLWTLMYDLSGLGLGDIESVIMRDWEDLNKLYNFTADSSYIRHKGKPLVALWGIGFNDNRKYTLEECKKLVDFIKKAGCTVMVGVPTYWREGGRDAVTGEQLKLLHQILVTVDVVSPWSVGRYRTPSESQTYAQTTLVSDIRWLKSYNVLLMPVVFPGFSWHNLQASGQKPDNPGPYNEIPRYQGGQYLLQVSGLRDIKSGAQALYVAMFDEMNEGTAIFKCSRNPPQLSDGLKFVAYDQDQDFYLKMVGRLGKALQAQQIEQQ